MIRDLREVAIEQLQKRCDELDSALARALDRIGNLESRLNGRDTLPAPGEFQAQIGMLGDDEEGGP